LDKRVGPLPVPRAGAAPGRLERGRRWAYVGLEGFFEHRMAMNKPRAHLPVIVISVALMAMMTALVVYSPTLYRMFCAVTGIDGTVRRVSLAKAATLSASDIPITVHFDANVAPELPWEFGPEQQKVVTHFGEPTKVYYYAKNTSNHPLVGRAVFNVAPYAAAPFFFKIECFCFTDEKLAPGESARMPLVFYVDQEMLKDPDAQMLTELTLSYTFYKQADRTAEELKSVRDLKSGSEATDANLTQQQSASFANDAPKH
jgi:cytochrome c oxidase assembly protein subunit 11